MNNLYSFFIWCINIKEKSDAQNLIPSLVIMRNNAHPVCNNNTMASTPAAAVPFVITFGYDNFTQGPSKRITESNVCGIKKDAGSTTSNFIRHLKTQLIDESLGNVKNVTAYGLLATLSIFRKKMI